MVTLEPDTGAPISVTLTGSETGAIATALHDSARAGGRRYRLSTAALQPRDRGLANSCARVRVPAW